LTPNRRIHMTIPAAADLETAYLVGLIGDVDGDADELLAISKAMWKRGVGTLLLLSGIALPTSKGVPDSGLDRINGHLRGRNQILYAEEALTDSSTDAPVDKAGVRWIRSNLASLPPAFRTTLRTGAIMATLRDAISSYAPGLPPRDVGTGASPARGEVEHALQHRIHILLGDPGCNPLPLTALANFDQEDAQASLDTPTVQDLIHRTRPNLYLGTHDTVAVDDIVRTGLEPDVFDTRVILLSRKNPAGQNQAILHIPTLNVSLFNYAEDTVDELTGDERGTWVVQTQSSRYIFDFGRPSVTRQPGPDAPATINDTTRRLRHIDSCRVGQSGAWTMKAVGGYADPVDFYWAVSTEIRSIERIDDQGDA
jgi:hypothetical protein